MEAAYIQFEQRPAITLGSLDSFPIYGFEEPTPQPSFGSKNRMMRANEALVHYRFGKQTIGEIAFSQNGIVPSPNMIMGRHQHCYLSALGYWVVGHQKWDLEYIPGYFNAEINIPKLNLRNKYQLELDHREFKAFDVRNTRIDISVNGKTLISNYSPGSLEFILDSFDITKYLKDGINIIKISFSKSGETIYGIRSLRIVES